MPLSSFSHRYLCSIICLRSLEYRTYVNSGCTASGEHVQPSCFGLVVLASGCHVWTPDASARYGVWSSIGAPSSACSARSRTSCGRKRRQGQDRRPAGQEGSIHSFKESIVPDNFPRDQAKRRRHVPYSGHTRDTTPVFSLAHALV